MPLIIQHIHTDIPSLKLYLQESILMGYDTAPVSNQIPTSEWRSCSQKVRICLLTDASHPRDRNL